MSHATKLTLNRETLRKLNAGSLGEVNGGEVTKPTICTGGWKTFEDCVEATCACELTGGCTITSKTRPTCKQE